MDKFKFRTKLAEDTFRAKYTVDDADTWPIVCRRVVEDVCGTRWGTLHPLMSKEDRDQLTQYMIQMKFIPAGRYLRFSGKPYKQYTNCFALIGQEDTREEWARIQHDTSYMCMTEGGVGVDLSVFRPSGYKLHRTGGIAGGPVCLGGSLNELIRYNRQGNDRRGALWLGLNWQHEDIRDFARAKDYPQELIDMNNAFPDLVKLPFDHTNMSILWDDAFYDEFAFTDDGLLGYVPELWYESVELMCRTGEPGHCYNFGENSDETGRNACTEFITDRDSDSCNLGSLNFSRITSKEELKDVTNLAAKFLVCGSIRGDTPNQACKETKEMARKIGLGIMGLHEWLLTRGYGYEVTAELHEWLGVYQHESERASCEHSERFFISPPTKFRSLAPTGTIGIIAGTSQGIEPLFGTAYKRRYRADGDRWAYQYEVSPVAKFLIEEHGVKEEDIETAVSLSENVEKRIRFQAELQSYIDMGISSTINLPAWGTESNNPDTAKDMSRILLRYCGNLRGITVYPDGARGFQPVTACTIEEAEKHSGIVYAEEDQCKSGVCGI